MKRTVTFKVNKRIRIVILQMNLIKTHLKFKELPPRRRNGVCFVADKAQMNIIHKNLKIYPKRKKERTSSIPIMIIFNFE